MTTAVLLTLSRFKPSTSSRVEALVARFECDGGRAARDLLGGLGNGAAESSCSEGGEEGEEGELHCCRSGILKVMRLCRVD